MRQMRLCLQNGYQGLGTAKQQRMYPVRRLSESLPPRGDPPGGGRGKKKRTKDIVGDDELYIADLHIHSRYSRATSKDCTPEHLDLWARRKGIQLVGTGDFTHPAWREELEEKLEPAGEGLYRLKESYKIKDDSVAGAQEPRFVITGEISSIYKKRDKVRKVHSLILLPGLSEAEEISRKLEAIGNIHSDTIFWRSCWSCARTQSMCRLISGRLISLCLEHFLGLTVWKSVSRICQAISTRWKPGFPQIRL